jgi:prepilin signal peptidase PulO-like enzyme (type II secretory pathway)
MSILILIGVTFLLSIINFSFYDYLREDKGYNLNAFFKTKEKRLKILFVFIMAIQIFLFFYLFGFSKEMFLLIYVFSLVTVGCVIDQEKFILPDKVTIPIIIFSLLLIPINPFLQNSIDGLIGGLAMFIIFLIFSFLGMGRGDLKLMTGLGLLLGIQTILLGTALGFLFGSLEGISLWLLKGYKKNMQMPFGPALSVGTIVSIFIVYSDVVSINDLLKLLGW